MMALVSESITKFVLSPNSHLLCKICGRFFHEPVINVKCGHTFCRECITKQSDDRQVGKCPQDQVTCDLEALVVNRSLSCQIDDLDIYCCHSVVWSAAEADYILDPSGCNTSIKYGNRGDHEDHCEYAPVPCPNNEALCGKIRQLDLTKHLLICSQHACHYSHKGCTYCGTSDEIAHHMSTCTYSRSPSIHGCSSTQLENLTNDNRKLQQKVDNLSTKVKKLEEEKFLMCDQLANCMNQLSVLRKEQDLLNEKYNMIGFLPSSSTPSSPLSRVPPGSAAVRSSTNPPPSPTRSLSPRDTWTMPFQFKCIGTLRNHKGGVWALRTHKNVLFSAGGDNFIKVWNLEKLEHGCTKTMAGHTGKIQALVTGIYLYSGGADRAIRSWSLVDYTQVHVIEGAHDDIVAALVCTDKYLFSSSHSVIKVWDVKTLESIHTMPSLKHWVRCLALSTNKDLLYSGSHNTVDIWDTQPPFTLKGKLSHCYGSVYSMAVTQQYIIVGTYNNNTHLFDVSTQNHLHKLSGHVGAIQSVCVTASGRFLFTASTDSKIQLWSLENYLPIQPLSRHEDSVNVILIHNDLLFSGSEDTEIKVFKYFKMTMGFNPA